MASGAEGKTSSRTRHTASCRCLANPTSIGVLKKFMSGKSASINLSKIHCDTAFVISQMNDRTELHYRT
jgi:hypothetical protein